MQQLPLEHAVVFLSSVMRSDAQVVRAAVFHVLMVHWGRSHPSGAVLLCHRHAGHSDRHCSHLEKRNPYQIFTCLGWWA